VFDVKVPVEEESTIIGEPVTSSSLKTTEAVGVPILEVPVKLTVRVSVLVIPATGEVNKGRKSRGTI